MSSQLEPLIRLEGQPYFNFINSLKSQPTKKEYRKLLLAFMRHHHISTLEGILSLTQKDIEQMLTNYITSMNARALSHGYINVVISALFHFFDMNDVILNKKKIKKFIGEYRKMNKDRAYTHEEVKKLVDTGDFRLKAIVLLLGSSGVRSGSIGPLLLRHLEKKENLYKVTIYENSREEHYSFTTPEAAAAIDEYLDYRKRCGEQVNGESPLFRTEFTITDIQKIRKNAKPVSMATIKSIIHSRLIKLGLIERSYEQTTKRDPGRRNIVPLLHGFRKFFTTQLINAKVNPEIREMLLGHKIGLSSAYYRPSEDEMLTEYQKAIDALTIDPTKRMARKIQTLEVEKNQFERLAAKIASLEQKINK